MDRRIARVFVRKTQYTPDDELVFFGPPDLLVPEVDEVHVSCLFSWDRQKAEWLAEQWESVAPVKIGGPAYTMLKGGVQGFTPGMYLRHGLTFTSRGCCNHCRFCMVPKQEGPLVELPVIHPGHWVLDNNLLACSSTHVEKVFDMLDGQKGVKLFGGLDVRILEDWHVERISRLKLMGIAIAFDHPKVEPYIANALRKLHRAGISHGRIWCFVLGGFFDWDTPEKAEERCRLVLKLGATPDGLVYRGPDEMSPRKNPEWSAWSRRWQWQKGIYCMAKREGLQTYHGEDK